MTVLRQNAISPSDLFARIGRALIQTGGLGLSSAGWASVLNTVAGCMANYPDSNLSVVASAGGATLTVQATSLADDGTPKTYQVVIQVS